MNEKYRRYSIVQFMFGFGLFVVILIVSSTNILERAELSTPDDNLDSHFDRYSGDPMTVGCWRLRWELILVFFKSTSFTTTK